MSSISSFKTLLLLPLLLLASCGFEPIHAQPGQETPRSVAKINPIFSSTYVKVVPERRVGQILRQELETQLWGDDKPSAARYTLSVTLEDKSVPAVITRENTIARYRITLMAKYSLLRLDTGQQIAMGSVSLPASYNIANSEFSTYMAERDLREREARELAHMIAMRLSATLSQGKP